MIFVKLGYAYAAGASSKVFKSNVAAGIFAPWSQLTTTSLPTFQINDISSIDGSVLVIVGDSGYIYKYQGSSWTQLMTSVTTSNLYALSQISNYEWFVVGADNFVAKTTNGGVTWTTLNAFTSGSTTMTQSTRPPHSISMLTSSVGMVGSVSGALLQTVNGGNHWADAMTLASAAGRMILSVSMYSSNVGVAGK